MKTKKFQKKLTLNKKTIVDLNNGQMKGVQGGAPFESLFLTVCKPTVCCTVYPCDTVHVGGTCCPAGGNSC